MTQRNLHATLQWVDRENPPASQLLTVPIQPHGSTDEVFTNQHMAQYQELIDWVTTLANPEPTDPPQPATIEPSQVLPEEATVPDIRPRPAFSPRDGEAERAGFDFPVAPAEQLSPEETKPSEEPLDVPLERAERGTSVKRGQPPKRFTPVDAFDPEIFNRRFFKKRSASERHDSGNCP
jgi:hypothetical protein